MKNQIVGVIILLVVLLLPFRYAFLVTDKPTLFMPLNMVLVVTGALIATWLFMEKPIGKAKKK